MPTYVLYMPYEYIHNMHISIHISIHMNVRVAELLYMYNKIHISEDKEEAKQVKGNYIRIEFLEVNSEAYKTVDFV